MTTAQEAAAELPPEPQKLADLSDNSPLKREFTAYLSRMGFAGTMDDIMIGDAPEDIRDTALSLMNALQVGEKDTVSSEPKDWSVRWMIRRDLHDALRSECDTYSLPLDESEMMGLMRQRNVIGLVAEGEVDELGEDNVVGHVLYSMRRDAIGLLTVGVKKEVRGQGVVESLLATITKKIVQESTKVTNSISTVHYGEVGTIGELCKILQVIAEGDDAAIRNRALLRLKNGIDAFPDSPFCNALRFMIAPLLQNDTEFLATEEGEKKLSALRATLYTLSRCSSKNDDTLAHAGNSDRNPEEQPMIELYDIDASEKNTLHYLVRPFESPEASGIQYEQGDHWFKATYEGKTVGIVAYDEVIQDDGKAIVIRRFHVAPRFRKIGVMEELSTELIQRLCDSESDRIWLPDSLLHS